MRHQRITPRVIERIEQVRINRKARRPALPRPRVIPDKRESALTELDFAEIEAECGLLDAGFDEEGAPF